jgi:hypothetical protein
MRKLVVAAILAITPPAIADQKLGNIEFRVTGGTQQARDHFMRGMLAMHSFWYVEATREMLAATKADPSFAMGWWGLAMSHSRLLWQDDDIAEGRAALAKITATDKLTARERAWIDAAAALFTDRPLIDRRKAFAAAVEKMHASAPDDDEVTTFLALAMISSYTPDDPDALAIRARAAALAMDVFQRNPLHPGAAHYIIHALDTPDLAPLALAAAKKYAQIAPEAFHARHMPAHIFARLGMWTDALASCKSAWDASLAWVTHDKLPADRKDWHSRNWMMNLEMLLGHRKQAEAALADDAALIRAGADYDYRAGYAGWVHEFLGYTEEWSRVDELLAPLKSPVVEGQSTESLACHPGAPPPPKDPDAPPKDKFEQISILNLRLEAAMRRHDRNAATKLNAELHAVNDKVKPFIIKQMGQAEWDRHEPDRKRMDATIDAATRGDDATQLQLMRETAAILDRQPAGENDIYDGGIHAGIADLLMRMKRPKEALAELVPVVKHHPRHSYLLRAAARAAAAADDNDAARAYYQQLLDVWATAEPTTPGLAEAKKYLSSHR